MTTRHLRLSVWLRFLGMWLGMWLGTGLAGSIVSAATPPADFTGTEITVGVQDVSAIGAPAKAHALTWQTRTGGRARVIQKPFGKLFEAYRESLTAADPVYDVILYAPAWAGDFAPYLRELPRNIAGHESLDDIHPTYRERLMTWNDKWIAVTIDGDLFSGYYRKDLFADPAHRAQFRARYGYALAPPDTWGQYRDIAEFFTGRQDADDRPLYGTAEAFASGGQQFWDVFSRASAYTNPPTFPGAQFFDPDTMQAQIDNPGWVRAVREYLEIRAFCPPQSRDQGIVEARRAFLSGQTAMILDWGDTAQLANDPELSRIRGKVGYFVLPGSRQVWNGRDWRWERTDEVHKAPFLAFGGWVASVPANSRHPEAAWDYILWLGSAENSLHDVVTAGTGINPYRLTHFSEIDTWNRAFPQGAASEYLEVLRTSLDSPNVAPDLRIPGFHQYTAALEEGLAGLLRAEGEVEETLHRVAETWEGITDRLGRKRQLALYRTAMGLDPRPAGPRPGAGRDKTQLVIGFSQATTTEPWRLLFNKELREEAARHPEVKLLVRDGMDRADKQATDVQELINQPVDALLISPKVAEALTPAVNRAFNAGIPVFVLDRDVSSDRYTQFIGGDNLEIGRAAGRYAVNLLGGAGHAKGQVVEIWGGMASTPAHERHQGFMEIIGREPGIRILNPPQDGDWKQDLGYDLMAEALARYPRIDLVYAHNDPMAHGAHLAAREVGREKEIFFLGIDGIPAEGVRWVKEGKLTATFLYKPPGEEGIRQALRYLGGKTVQPRLTLPTLTIDRGNADQILRRHGLD